MKKFQFPLAQAMEWRQTRLRQEQARAEKTVTGEPSITGAELKRLDDFTRAARIELERLQITSLDCQKRIAAQTGTVIQKRRDVRLLERLHERKLTEWKADFARELDKEAEELHLGRYSARYP